MPHLGEFTTSKHAGLSAQGDLHTPKLHASRHHDGGADEIELTDIDSLACKIKSGSYTGDDSTSQAITGVGFQPKLVIIQKHVTTMTDHYIFIKHDQDVAALCSRISGSNMYLGVADAVIALGTDGFTVDDGGANADPNKKDVTYDYVAFG